MSGISMHRLTSAQKKAARNRAKRATSSAAFTLPTAVVAVVAGERSRRATPQSGQSQAVLDRWTKGAQHG